MWARFTVLSETPIAAAIAGCAIPLSRSNTIRIRCRCASGIFQCNAVFNCRIWRFVHLTICIPESDGHKESYNFPRERHQITTNSPIQSALEVVSGVIDHVAFSSRGFEAMKQHLTGKGVLYRVNQTPNSTRWQIFLRDPNNVEIELN